MKILLIEDNAILASSLVDALTSHRYIVDVANDGEMGWEYALSSAYDLIILDVMLPKIDGVTLCQRLRKQNYTVPILILTACDALSAKVGGLDAGADDYLVKPIKLPELLARIRALLRRSATISSSVLLWGAVKLDLHTCEVTYGEAALQLTPKEYLLLQLLLRNGQRVVNREAIADQLWNLDRPPTDDAIKVHLKSLRAKLRQAGAPEDLIETVRGIGYRMNSVHQGEGE